MEKELKEMIDYNQKRANVFHGRASILFALIFFLVLFGLASFLTGCKSVESEEKPEEKKIEIPNNFKLISKSNSEQFGIIYQYTCDADTLYIVEGRSSSYPIAMTIKQKN